MWRFRGTTCLFIIMMPSYLDVFIRSSGIDAVINQTLLMDAFNFFRLELLLHVAIHWNGRRLVCSDAYRITRWSTWKYFLWMNYFLMLDNRRENISWINYFLMLDDRLGNMSYAGWQIIFWCWMIDLEIFLTLDDKSFLDSGWSTWKHVLC